MSYLAVLILKQNLFILVGKKDEVRSYQIIILKDIKSDSFSMVNYLQIDLLFDIFSSNPDLTSSISGTLGINPKPAVTSPHNLLVLLAFSMHNNTYDFL